MDERSDQTTSASAWPRRFWLALIAAVVVAHGWLTLSQFGPTPELALTALLSDEPLAVGEHAFHQYHAWLAGRALREGQIDVYDPAFGGGYPRTPWFDMHTRPMELAYAISGGTEFHPGPYKLALALVWMGLPVLLMVAAYQAGVDVRHQGMVLLFMTVLLWSEWGRSRLHEGDVAFPLAATALVVSLARWTRYQQRPSVLNGLAWAFWAGAAMVFHPLVILLAFPAWLAGYSRAGWRRRLSAQVADVVGVAGAFALGWPWWRSMGETWWLMATDPIPASPAVPVWIRVLETAPLGWHHLVMFAIVALGTGGLIIARNGPRAGLAFALAGAMVVAALAGIVEPATDWPCASAAERWWFVVLVLAVFPATEFMFRPNAPGRSGPPMPWIGLALVAAAVAGMANLTAITGSPAGEAAPAPPLKPGLGETEKELCNSLMTTTSQVGRILFEDTPKSLAWTPLLPVLTRRTYLGGLAGHPPLEQLHGRLYHGWLGPRELADWTPEEFQRWSQRWNVRWLVVTRETAPRLQGWPFVRRTTTVGPWTLLEVASPPSYFLQGRGRLVRAKAQELILTDVEPVDGVVLLSFHYHGGARPSSDRVVVDGWRHPDEPVPLLRLKLAKPISRLAISWGSE